MAKKQRIGILGGGSWATAIAKILLNNMEEINWYMRRQEQIDEFIRLGRNPSYLTGVKFDTDRIRFTNNLNRLVGASDILIFAVPSPFLKDHLRKLRRKLNKKIIISAVKGVIQEDNLILTDFFAEKYTVPKKNLAVLAGPSHAEEIALERISYLTLASESAEKAQDLSSFFTTNYVRTTISTDVTGIEYAAIMKNIYAIAAGICHGLKYGDNFQAVLLSNAIQEVNSFCYAANPKERDIKQSAYLGDLLVTAYSQFSRNRLFGNMLGKGYSVKAAQIELGMIAEGYYAVKCIHEINQQLQVDMPIIESVYNILYNKALPRLEIRELSNQLK